LAQSIEWAGGPAHTRVEEQGMIGPLIAPFVNRDDMGHGMEHSPAPILSHGRRGWGPKYVFGTNKRLA